MSLVDINSTAVDSTLSQYTTVLVNSYAEKSPALAAADLVRMMGQRARRSFCLRADRDQIFFMNFDEFS